MKREVIEFLRANRPAALRAPSSLPENDSPEEWAEWVASCLGKPIRRRDRDEALASILARSRSGRDAWELASMEGLVPESWLDETPHFIKNDARDTTEMSPIPSLGEMPWLLGDPEGVTRAELLVRQTFQAMESWRNTAGDDADRLNLPRPNQGPCLWWVWRNPLRAIMPSAPLGILGSILENSIESYSLTTQRWPLFNAIKPRLDPSIAPGPIVNLILARWNFRTLRRGNLKITNGGRNWDIPGRLRGATMDTLDDPFSPALSVLATGYFWGSKTVNGRPTLFVNLPLDHAPR